MDTRRLRHFVTIVDAGSITRAAAELGIAQPALSQQLAVLEGELKAKLLDRSPAGVSPTAAGAILYQRARSVLRQIDELQSEIHGVGDEVVGRATVGLTPTIALAVGFDLLRTMAARHPKVRFHLNEGGSTTLEAQIIHGALDVILTPVRLNAEGIDSAALVEEPLFVAGSDVMPPEGSVEELARLPWIVTSAPNAIRALLDAAFAESGCKPLIAAEIDSLPVVVRAVEEGLGLSLLPSAVVEQPSQQGRVRLASFGGRDLRRTLYLSRRTTPSASPAAAALAQVLAEVACTRYADVV